MKNFKIIFILAAVLLTGSLVFAYSVKKTSDKSTEPSVKVNKLKIAACPTCYTFAQKVDNGSYEIILTSSTAESLYLLQTQKVDMVLAGRTLKPEEPKLPFLIVREGFSFLAKDELYLYIDELEGYKVFTDLEPSIIQEKIPLKNIYKVEEVYNYLDQGIIITSWENTDYARAEIVHVLESSGKRVDFSRQPTLYCSLACAQEAQDVVKLLK